MLSNSTSFAAVSARLRELSLCSKCGRPTDVLNVARRGYRPEIVTVATHCACPGGPAAPATSEKNDAR